MGLRPLELEISLPDSPILCFFVSALFNSPVASGRPASTFREGPPASIYRKPDPVGPVTSLRQLTGQREAAVRPEPGIVASGKRRGERHLCTLPGLYGRGNSPQTAPASYPAAGRNNGPPGHSRRHPRSIKGLGSPCLTSRIAGPWRSGAYVFHVHFDVPALPLRLKCG